MHSGPTILDADDQRVVTDAGRIRERLPRPITELLFMGVLGMLMFGPLALGAVDPWAIFTLEAGAALLLLVWTIAAAVSPLGLRIRLSPLLAPMLLYFSVGVLQLLLHRSAYAYNGVMELQLDLAYGALAFLMLQSMQRNNDFTKLGWLLAAFGFAVAAFGIWQSLDGNGKIYWVVTRPEAVIFGPYANHSHYAGLMELVMPFALVLAAGRMERGGRRSILAFAAAFMAGSVMLAHSTGGVIALAAETLIFFLLVKRTRKGAPIDLRAAAAVITLGIATTLFLFWADRSHTLEQLTSLHDPLHANTTTSRLAIAKDSLHMFTGRPILGWGLGNFALVYPKYQSYYSLFLINHAHNDFLEALTEAGLIGFGAMVWFVVVLYRSATSKIANWRTDMRASIRFAALIGCTGMLIHGLYDFNLHIPGNAALFFALSWLATGGRASKENAAHAESAHQVA
jgi:O-antigen ligase